MAPLLIQPGMCFCVGMEDKTVRIECEGSSTIDIDLLEPYQGNLKDLTQENYSRLKKEILELGFSEPISVWATDGHHYVLNGHQRLRTLKQMRDEGFEVPDVPIVAVTASGEKEAKKKILALTSQYGQMTSQGLYEFMSNADLTFADVADSFRFPELDMGMFKQEFFEDDPGGLNSDGGLVSGGETEPPESRKLSDRFLVPPFSVLDTRQGYWQERKRQWLSLGIKSELGRGGASPGGSPRPATQLGPNGRTQRGDGAGRTLGATPPQ